MEPSANGRSPVVQLVPDAAEDPTGGIVTPPVVPEASPMEADHDRAEAERLQAEAERLRADLAEASARLVAVKARAAEREAATRDALRAAVVEARETVAELERHHQAQVDAIRSAATAEVERILADARRLADDSPTGSLTDAELGDAG